MNPKKFLFSFCALLIFASCTEKEKAPERKKLYIKNTLGIDRNFETVAVAIDSLDLVETASKEGNLVVIEDASGKQLISQVIDSNGDGKDDTLLFQPDIKAEAEMAFTVSQSDSVVQGPEYEIARCYSRFVPERTDDYAWENNRVAFRTYGPTAQQMAEDGVKGGTLSSGIDAWLKRVEYPIIDKWYKKELETDGSYHEDTGEGLDNYHVGTSRGVGGIAIKGEDSYYISKNFVSWKTLYNGPIRTSFVLTYANWDAAGNQISEKKHISLDYGSNLSKFEIDIEGTDTISAGLTLHENEGITQVNEEEGWISYWEPHEGSELGTGIVVPNGNMAGYDKYETEEKDLSNLFAHVALNEGGKAVYYTGFAWKKSGQFETQAEWEAYLSAFAEKLKNPLTIEVR